MEKEKLNYLIEYYKMTPEQHKECLQRIRTAVFNGKTPVINPQMKIVIGQTGAGKSTLTNFLLQQEPNYVLVAGDNCKPFRHDAEEIFSLYPTESNALTRYDSHKHMLEIYEETIKNNFNAIIEKAPSTPKTNLKNFWNEYVIPENYKTEYDILAVSDLNSLLSTRERYENQILSGCKIPKLTEIARHDDSFIAVQSAVKNLTTENDVKIFIRGNDKDYTPIQVFPNLKFNNPQDCVKYYQNVDTEKTKNNYKLRCDRLRKLMIGRNALKHEFDELDEIYERCKNR